MSTALKEICQHFPVYVTPRVAFRPQGHFHCGYSDKPLCESVMSHRVHLVGRHCFVPTSNIAARQ